MWYVEIIKNWETGERERYEGLTLEESAVIHKESYAAGAVQVISGRMEE